MRTVLVAVVLLSAAVAEAYMPPASFVMNLVAQKRQKQKLDAMRVWLKRTAYDKGQPVGDAVEHVVTYRQGGRVRRDWTDAAGKHGYLADANRAVLLEGDKRTKATPEPDLFAALWATGGEADEREAALGRANALLEAWGLGDGQAFARVDGRIAWVEGGTAPGVTQVWVDKDDFLLLRVVYPTGPRKEGEPLTGPWMDVRYRSWGTTAGGEFHPARVETWQDGVLVRVEELVKVDVTPKIDERDFKFE